MKLRGVIFFFPDPILGLHGVKILSQFFQKGEDRQNE
jgi:hypothetical protein